MADRAGFQPATLRHNPTTEPPRAPLVMRCHWSARGAVGIASMFDKIAFRSKGTELDQFQCRLHRNDHRPHFMTFRQSRFKDFGGPRHKPLP